MCRWVACSEIYTDVSRGVLFRTSLYFDEALEGISDDAMLFWQKIVGTEEVSNENKAVKDGTFRMSFSFV